MKQITRFSIATLACLSLLATGCSERSSKKPQQPTVEPVVVKESIAVDTPTVTDAPSVVEVSKVKQQPKVQDPPRVVSYDAVLKFKPVGYWPADDAEGEVLRDLSGGGNHGAINNVPWRDGFLDFENDVYQWVEVPYTSEFGSENFSMGGWLYSGFDKSREDGHIGAILIGQPFVESGADQLRWGAIWGERIDTSGALLRYGIPSKKKGTYLEVASGQQSDVIGTAADEVALPHGQWQHLFYTYEYATGKGSLYLNGQLIKSADNVPFTPTDTPLVIGAGRWGTFNLGGTRSLDGTLRHMTYFDRPLSPDEVKKIADLTHPPTVPVVTPYSKRKAKAEAVAEAQTPSQLLQSVRNKQLDDFARGQAALGLAALGAEAKPAIPALAEELRKLMQADGIHLPKVEEFFRNALIQALLSIDRNDAVAKKVLGRTLVEPYFESVDLKAAHFRSIRLLIRSEQWFEALDAYNAHMASLPKVTKFSKWGSFDSPEAVVEHSKLFPLSAEYFEGYLSKNVPYADAGYSAYNIVDNTLGGYSYMTMYEPVPYEEVLQQFDKHLKGLTDKRPEHTGAKALDKKTIREWNRVKIIQMTPHGDREEVYLEGPWFIFDTRDEKMEGWSIITDKDGYIHVWGGQHNSPNQDNYIPGSWEKLGFAEGNSRASNMYWVSKKPHDTSDFEFVGHGNNPRNLKGWLNYMNLVRSRSGQILIYCRGDMWTWALHRYDADTQRWTKIKGSAKNMFNAAEKKNPEWSANLGETVPYYGPADGFVVAWQPGAYNFCRTWPNLVGKDVAGITFDASNRMHVSLSLLGVIEGGEVAQRPVYAYSDDLGDTFYSADGEPLELPLTHNPIPGHNADRTIGPAKSYFEVWASLVREFK